MKSMERDIIIQFKKDSSFNIDDYPNLKKKHPGWRNYAGSCFRGFTELTDDELK